MIHKIKEQVTMGKTEEATTRVQLCNDGKYRWVHEVSLYKNPVILLGVCGHLGLLDTAARMRFD